MDADLFIRLVLFVWGSAVTVIALVLSIRVIERLRMRRDWLEAFIEEQRTLVLHINANCYGYSGIGLRAGDLNRSLRQAIEATISVNRGKGGREKRKKSIKRPAGKVPAAAAGAASPRSPQAGTTSTKRRISHS